MTESEIGERYRTLLECAGDAILMMDPEGTIQFCNEAVEKIFYSSRSEVVGQTLSQLFETPSAVDIGKIFHKVKGQRQPERFLGTLRPKEGGPLFVETVLSLMQNPRGQLMGFAAIVRDQTMLKRIQAYGAEILEAVEEGFVVLDRDCRILSANRAYGQLMGGGAESLIGQECIKISHSLNGRCCEHCTLAQTFSTGKPGISLHTHIGPQGQPRQVEAKTYAIKDERGSVKSVVEVISDVTEKWAQEHQLRHAQKMESIGTLAGGIAHDFNNILTAINGHGHVALMSLGPDDPLRKTVEAILESVSRAAALTKSLLTFSRSQMAVRKYVDLNLVIRKVEKLLVRVMGDDVVVRLNLAKRELMSWVDAGQMEQLLMNFATNARDAMPSGGLFMIQTSVATLDHRLMTRYGKGRMGRYVRIQVTDTGHGMDEQTKKKIFEPFFTTKGVGRGTGLGLAMVYGIIEQNGGFIDVMSEPSTGTTFVLYFPLVSEVLVQKVGQAIERTPQGGSETILFAEDDSALRDVNVQILEHMGYRVITAVDGVDAIEKFLANRQQIDLLLFDMMMPKKSGRDAYDRIHQESPHIPVLFVSGYSPGILLGQSLVEKGEEIIYKPISPTALLVKVRAILDSQKQ